jgi:N-acetylmuramoyl-L-alanine amidase
VSLTHPSPNFGDRRGKQVDLVVVHYTAMPTCATALERLCDPAAEVSAHYLIDMDGTLLSLVDEGARAWHAGAGTWRGEGDVNSRSIGIELANPGDRPFPDPQMRALERLLAEILHRHRLPPEAVIAHSDMAPERKSDPGARFDWRRLAMQGLSVWPVDLVPSPPPQPLPTGEREALPSRRRAFVPTLRPLATPTPRLTACCRRSAFASDPGRRGRLMPPIARLQRVLGRFAVDASCADA